MADRLGLSYRQLDYLARILSLDPHHLGARGSGTRRVWPPYVVARLEVAQALLSAVPTLSMETIGGPTWTGLARAVLEHDQDPPPSGWVILDDLGDLHYCTTSTDLGRVLGRGSGAVVARFARQE